jgi:hypothetical protein
MTKVFFYKSIRRIIHSVVREASCPAKMRMS